MPVRRLFVLVAVTLLGLIGAIVLLWRGWGRRAEQGANDLTPEYLAKKEAVSALKAKIVAAGNLSPAEMVTLRQFLSDPDWRIRARALAALRAFADSPQRSEAVALARESLKHEDWLTRALAIRALVHLKAREAVPDIMPLLNDPEANVRDEARKALQQLGYAVR